MDHWTSSKHPASKTLFMLRSLVPSLSHWTFYLSFSSFTRYLAFFSALSLSLASSSFSHLPKVRNSTPNSPRTFVIYRRLRPFFPGIQYVDVGGGTQTPSWKREGGTSSAVSTHTFRADSHVTYQLECVSVLHSWTFIRWVTKQLFVVNKRKWFALGESHSFECALPANWRRLACL